MKNIITDYIHPDQNGFIPKRQIKTNTRMILNILEYYEQKPDEQMALAFLDAQKAFDNLNWTFLIIQLEKMRVGENFLNMIKSIYFNQTARIWINGEITDQFEIAKGVRQGCPLSPLLFILALEILLNEIRGDKEIQGLKNQEYKLQAFADDVVFILERPKKSGMTLLETIEQYGKVAGLKINKQKTKILTKNVTKHRKRNWKMH